MSLTTRARVPELDGLRGLAILLVLLWHYLLSVGEGVLPDFVVRAGSLAWSGVDLFFVLSGFLIGGILLDERDSPNYFRAFYLRRFYRILPAYFAVLVVFYIAGPYVSAWLAAESLPWYSYASFTQNLWMARRGTLGPHWLAVTWSLAIEEQFYLTLPLLIRFLPAKRLSLALLGCILAAPVLRTLLHVYYPNGALASYVLMPCRMDGLMLGVLAAWYMKRGGRVPARLLYPALAVLFVGVCVMSFRGWSYGSLVMDTAGYTWLALFYLALLLAAIGGKFRAFRLRPLVWLGIHAYGIYLLHEIVRGLLSDGEPDLNWSTPLALLLTLVLAAASWKYFEKPLVARGHRFKYQPLLGHPPAFVENRASD